MLGIREDTVLVEMLHQADVAMIQHFAVDGSEGYWAIVGQLTPVSFLGDGNLPGLSSVRRHRLGPRSSES